LVSYTTRKIALTVVFALQIAARGQTIELKLWGYAPPARRPVRFSPEATSNPHPIGIYRDGNVVVCFVTREGAVLGTRKQPGLTLHLVTFDRKGQFLGQKTRQTTDWYENGVFVAPDGNLLVRTGTTLRLYSKDADLIAERDLGGEGITVLPSPVSSAFVLTSDRQPHQLDLVSAKDLTPLKTCSYPDYHRVTSVSEHNVLLSLSSPPNDPLLRTVEVHEICGPKQFTYMWNKLPLTATLLDDTHTAITGPNLIVMDRDVTVWADSFKSRHESIEGPIRVGGNGNVVGVPVTRYAGGSDFLDLDAHLRSIRIVVYNSHNGKHIAEVSVHELPKYVFDFAVSPDGKLLTILSDGGLQIIPIGTD